MTERRFDDDSTDARLCVAGLVYFEIFLPDEGLDVTPGEETFVERIDVGLGGALNPATVAAALGIETTVAHPSGDGLTDDAVAAARDKLGIAALTWPAGDDPAISLIRSADKERSFVSCADRQALRNCPELSVFDWLHIPGLEEAHQLAAQIERARSTGVTVSVAGSWAPARLDALNEVTQPIWDVLLLNGREARRATESCPSMAARARQLTDVANDVVVTDGPGAVHAAVGGCEYSFQVPPVENFVDATGAGDSFGAGYIAARLKNIEPEKALKFAISVARLVVTQRGGLVDKPSRFNVLREQL